MIQRARITSDARGADEPLEVQLIEFPSEVTLEAYLADDRRTALADGRHVAIARAEILRVDLV